jgi:hypothetical protein
MSIPNSSVSAISQPSVISKNTLFFDNFRSYAVGSGYSYFASGAAVGDDGVATPATSGNPYLDINSGVGGAGFTKSLSPSPIPNPTGGLDHVHYLVYRDGAFNLPNDGTEFIYEARAAAETQPGTIPSGLEPVDLGVTNATDDIRIAGSAVNSIDFVSWMVFDVFFSNETIYAFYERLPFGKPSFGGPGPDYHAFSHCIPIAKRNKSDPLSQFDTVAIAINRAEGTVRWLVNGEEKFRVKDIGLPLDRSLRILDHGGPATKVDLKQINIGFGTFTLLDMLNPVYSSLPQALAVSTMNAAIAVDFEASIDPNRPLVQLGIDAQYIDPQRTDNVTGDDLAVGSAPSAAGGAFNFLVPSDIDTSSRLFGNGARLRLQWIRASITNNQQIVTQFPSVS